MRDGTDDALGRRERQLAEDGAEPLRLELLRRARRFKRSWIDMAEALLELRENRAYESWGYTDFYNYCAEELLIKRRTVDKLTGTLSTLERHAPEVLRGGEEQNIPTFDSLDYFARAMEKKGESEGEDVEELRAAVFDQGKQVSALRRQFNPVFFAKSEPELALETLARADAAAERLRAMIDELPGLSRDRAGEVAVALEALRADLVSLIESAQARAAVDRAS